MKALGNMKEGHIAILNVDQVVSNIAKVDIFFESFVYFFSILDKGYP